MKRILLHRGLLIALIVVGAGHTSAEQLEAFTEPYRRVAVPSPEIGVIAQILVAEGDEVSGRQVLAKLDDRVLQASLRVASAAKDAMGSVRSAETELKMRDAQLESYRGLHEEGNASQRELELAETEYRQAASRLQSVREDLEIRRLEYERVKAQIRQRTLESPIDGIVMAIDKEVGEFVSPTDPIVMHIVHLDMLKSVFSVPFESASNLRTGQRVQLKVGYRSVETDGVIEFISPVADAESNSVRVKVRIPNSNQALPSGVVCHWTVPSDADRPEPSQARRRTEGKFR